MGRYSSSGLAHGTNGAPQITVEESSYSLKIAEVISKLSLKQIQDKTTGTVVPDKKKNKKKNRIELIIALILSMGYRRIIINSKLMFIKNDIVINVKYIEEYDYYILEKADGLVDAQNNYFELLASISNEESWDRVLETVKNILSRIE